MQKKKKIKHPNLFLIFVFWIVNILFIGVDSKMELSPRSSAKRLICANATHNKTRLFKFLPKCLNNKINSCVLKPELRKIIINEIRRYNEIYNIKSNVSIDFPIKSLLKIPFNNTVLDTLQVLST